MVFGLFKKKSRGRALIVDDEHHIRTLLSKYLEMKGFECTLASDGQAAAGLLAGQSFNVLLTDLTMPKINGGELIKLFREDHPEEPIFVITGLKDAALETKIKAKWDNIFIFQKPFKGKEVMEAIDRACPPN